ncbi:CaiB/BaiF CoA-transferase family protein [Aliiglaciecola sp. 3_MG-2023]|uniref:CaiB/BaiF CoA transferase family protein n=1 Tax=Aliiglaciecola sp. 3_MG-2023 TaxID=3062644 RepID=UPI0026E1D458|nr:CaiB/BaiF CoA-transferase family protein [Aliiglaciecola sp. 3_MG-2023]MDO6693042.1 CaiB/BaiF CoA-transferase family protein [Aliiglaciecola sp. 3_MG-2023]
MSSGSSYPLADLKVVEFTHMVMGPTTGVVLADLGAVVTKIEPLEGDKTRRLKGSGAGYFPMYNRNKRSVCIDLKSAEGKEVALNLIREADVLIENFRPGAMEKLGFGYEAMSQLNPGLIYCSLKGFLTGPYENRTALDEVTQMMGGLAYMTGLPDRPMRAGSSVIDITGGMFGVIGILSALHERQITAKGRHVTSSLFETTAYLVGQHMAQEVVLGEAPPPMSVRRSAWSVYQIFNCKNDERVFVGVVSDTLWKHFCKEFELNEFLADSSLDKNNDRVTQRDRIIPVIEAIFSELDKQTMMDRLERAGIPFAPINTPSDLFEDPQLNSGGLLPVTTPQGIANLPSLPIELDGKRTTLHHDLPKEGEDTIRVLQEAGYNDKQIAELISLNIVKAIPAN